jgi:molecular chaperone GrpE
MTNDPTKSARVVDAEDEVVEAELPEPAEVQAQEPEPEEALSEDAATEGPEPADQPDPVAAKAAKADEYLALAQRTQADFENYRRRATKEAAAAQAKGVIKLAKELLPAVDDLDRALAAAEAAADAAVVTATEAAIGTAAEAAADADAAAEDDNPLVAGIKLVHADMVAALARVGIESYSPQGEPFDPQHHEAVAQMPTEGAEPGTIVEVYQRGYTLGDSIIRPARVVVAA